MFQCLKPSESWFPGEVWSGAGVRRINVPQHFVQCVSPYNDLYSDSSVEKTYPTTFYTAFPHLVSAVFKACIEKTHPTTFTLRFHLYKVPCSKRVSKRTPPPASSDPRPLPRNAYQPPVEPETPAITTKSNPKLTQVVWKS